VVGGIRDLGCSDWRDPCLLGATGVVLGVLVSLSSVGAGALGMTALLLLYPSLPVATLVAFDIAHAVPLTLIAGLGHWYLGSIDWPVLAALLVGSLPGIVAGSLAGSGAGATRCTRGRAVRGGRAAGRVAQPTRLRRGSRRTAAA
jgi:uncharacterized membrane protein YfcA